MNSRSYLTRSLGLFLILLLTTLGCGISQVQATFRDTETTPYQEAIDYLQSQGSIQGYRNGTEFQPNAAINLASFLKIALTNFGFDPQANRISRVLNPFTDIPQKAWFASYFQRGWEINMLNNTTTINPGKSLTRAEGVQLILKLLNINTPRVISADEWSSDYLDVDSQSWFAPIVFYGQNYELLTNLSPDNSRYFRPHDFLTRGEAAQLIYNMDLFLYKTALKFNISESLLDENLNFVIPNLDLFVDVWNRVNHNYYKTEEIDQNTLIYQAIKGMVNGLGDAHSVFFNPEETGEFTQAIEGKFGGIGVFLRKTDDGLRIEGFVINSPAEASGLKYDDLIIGVDDVLFTNQSVDTITNMIKGDPNTNVTLIIKREGASTPLKFVITREIIDLGVMQGEMKNNAIYVDINTFDQNGAVDFETTIKNLISKNSNFKGFIFDLRNNGGGYLSTVHQMLGHFIPNGDPVVYEEFRSDYLLIYSSLGQGEWRNYPIVILINEGTASASEIMALALKEKNNAVLVGTKSYGKGTVQNVYPYSDGSQLNLTVAKWLSPLMNNIDGVGITPDYVVTQPQEDLKNNRDPQLEKALEIFKGLTR
ncbi:MAG: carboxy-terminal-processing protease, carboxyl-terminal processing protease [Candidatus Peregrinibacteria bacterium GW2011_GWE2_39_6]|nr:MAG: carboxy-terminal-processing protease, carboxyl-terminal processing protease [Candidatus Peregrinibacteria bacterium GW2011_GWE2_39_6]